MFPDIRVDPEMSMKIAYVHYIRSVEHIPENIFIKFQINLHFAPCCSRWATNNKVSIISIYKRSTCKMKCYSLEK